MALLPALAPPAHALDAYWHGVRDKFWHHGTNGEFSNWYDKAPQSGNPVKVPDGTAIFAPGALRKRAEVEGARSIRSVVFDAGTDPYAVVVRAASALTIRGQGTTNASGVDQKFLVGSRGSKLYFVKKAKACNTSGAHFTLFKLNNGGKVYFKNKAKSKLHCAFSLKGKSLLRFADATTAGKSDIYLDSPRATVKFINNSDPKNAYIEVLRGQAVFRTFGLNGNRKISARKIDDLDILDLGKSDIKLRKSMVLGATSETFLSVANLVSYGRVHAATNIFLGGVLNIEGSFDAKAGTYTLFEADKLLVPGFATVKISGFNKKLDAKVVKNGSALQLVLSKKP